MRFQLALYTLFMDFCVGRHGPWWLKYRLKKWLKHGEVSRIVFFMMDVEPFSTAKLYRRYMEWTPWKRNKKYWDLSEWNESYWEKLDAFIGIAKQCGVMLIPNLFPFRYCEYIFRMSIQRAEAIGYYYNLMWAPQLRKYQLAYIDRAMAVLRKHYSYPWISLSNEVRHSNHNEGHDIGVAHRDWLEQSGVPLEKCMLDGSHSEFVYEQLVEEHDSWGVRVGDDKYGRSIRHHVICEHGIGTATDAAKVIQVYDNSEWKKRPHAVFSSDGGNGSGDQYVLGHWSNANHDELYDKCEVVWGHSPGFIIEELPMEIWKRTKDDYYNAYADYGKLKLGRMRVIAEARRNIFNGINN